MALNLASFVAFNSRYSRLKCHALNLATKSILQLKKKIQRQKFKKNFHPNRWMKAFTHLTCQHFHF